MRIHSVAFIRGHWYSGHVFSILTALESVLQWTISVRNNTRPSIGWYSAVRHVVSPRSDPSSRRNRQTRSRRRSVTIFVVVVHITQGSSRHRRQRQQHHRTSIGEEATFQSRTKTIQARWCCRDKRYDRSVMNRDIRNSGQPQHNTFTRKTCRKSYCITLI